MNGTIHLAERWVWLGTSILIALLGMWVSWWQQNSPKGNAMLARWEQLPEAPWIFHSIRLLYAIGFPAAALLGTGSLTERGLGLQPLWLLDSSTPASQVPLNWIDWVSDLGWTLVIFLVAGCILEFARRTAGLRPASRDGGAALREACYHQAHWAFYREPFVLIWGPAIGAWVGLLPVAFEAALNPYYWRALRTSAAPSRRLLFRATLAIVSLLLYIQTQNLWLTLLADTGLGWFWGQE